MSEPFIGELKCVGFNFPPRGWAQCDGQTLQISQNTALFSLFGTIYGGDGRTTFSLPELRGRSPIHMGTGPGLPNFGIGSSGGNVDTTLAVSNLPSHSHAATLRASGGNASETAPMNRALATAREDTYQSLGAEPVNMESGSVVVGSTGSGEAFSNMSPYQTLNWVVALIGVFPSRS